MNIFLTIIIISLLVLLAVVAYNMRQETLYRNKIRSQFGHADQDALLNAAAQSVTPNPFPCAAAPQPSNLQNRRANPLPKQSSPKRRRPQQQQNGKPAQSSLPPP